VCVSRRSSTAAVAPDRATSPPITRRSTRWLAAAGDSLMHAAIDDTERGKSFSSNIRATICAIVSPASFITASVSSADRRWMWLIISSMRWASVAGRACGGEATAKLISRFELIGL